MPGWPPASGGDGGAGGGGYQGGRPPGRLSFVAGDALRLPFRDGAFDAVTISFGLRNVADPVAGLAEMRRVTRPGGRLVVCEFSALTIAQVDMLYRRYLLHVLPAIARRAARNPEAYEYLAESIVDWPAQRELAGLIETAGWSAVRWRNLSLGAVAVHVARRAYQGPNPGHTDPGHTDPGARCSEGQRPGERCPRIKPRPARSKLMAKNL